MDFLGTGIYVFSIQVIISVVIREGMAFVAYQETDVLLIFCHLISTETYAIGTPFPLTTMFIVPT